MEWLTVLLGVLGNIVVAVVAIIPTIITNRKKTQESIKETNDKTDKRMEKIQTTLDNHIREDEDDKARNQRYRILRFYDEMCEGKRHSESHFEDILDDIDDYESYCENHKDFKNSRGHLAMKYIRESYGKVKADGGFLTHE